MPWEEPAGQKPSCSRGQKASRTGPARRPRSTSEMVARALSCVSTESVPGETPSQPRSLPCRSRVSMDDLWLEKSQRKKLQRQAQVERRMLAAIVPQAGVKSWRKTIITSPEPSNLPRRSCPLSQSAPVGLNHSGWLEHVPDTGNPPHVWKGSQELAQSGSMPHSAPREGAQDKSTIQSSPSGVSRPDAIYDPSASRAHARDIGRVCEEEFGYRLLGVWLFRKL
ncbi:rho guanine nucleotide exchange factor 4-like [Carlito syrichta]|uniref:Rho guanine nucleotide exchange factor 4-like n=1 Tax=Carlito syrichta TaxID=1868482 RepID=A0A3Q0E900_CARSF|nr:rho guanine nucleotide exchange factor 4-like [Carlito syrichta]